jgi:hypothetical protein
MNLTDQQRSAARAGEWARWIDPESGQEYVLVPREHLEKMQAVLGGMTRHAGWDDPALDDYERYRKHS